MTAAHASESTIFTAEPPEEVARLLGRLKAGEELVETSKALAAHPHAAPYLRAELAEAKGRFKQDIQAVLDVIAGQRFERNCQRMREQDWAGNGRLDVLGSLICAAPKDSAAIGPADHLLRANRQIMGNFSELADLKRQVTPFDARGLGPQRVTHYSGGSVTVPKQFFGVALVRGEKCRIDPHERSGWVLAVNSELDDPLQWPEFLVNFN
ncbi:MAG: hypothetical protein K2V38_14085, partial [Gemmataceae bacterium]|nr:hypothetical protein [Gemmataceae bacterium]